MSSLQSKGREKTVNNSSLQTLQLSSLCPAPSYHFNNNYISQDQPLPPFPPWYELVCVGVCWVYGMKREKRRTGRGRGIRKSRLLATGWSQELWPGSRAG